MAKHIANVRLSGEGGQSAAVPLSVVQLPVSAIGNNNNQSAIFHSESGQTIQMIKVGNRFYQVNHSGSGEGNASKNKTKLYDEGESSSLKLAYIKSEKVDMNNSFSSHDDDDEDSIHLDEDGSEQSEGQLLNLALTNSSGTSTSGGSAIVQGTDGRFFIPVSVLSSGMSSLPQNIIVHSSEQGSGDTSPGVTEELTMKREIRLYKNREAARECRRKKKEYVRCLENRVALLENQNKTLINELKSLKELYCQKEPHS